MGFFSEDMLLMLGVYEAETAELMATQDAIISRVEREKAFTDEDIAELFRCAHTVKGSSAMMGLDALSTLTHKIEDLFDLLRGDPSLAEGHVPDIIDRLYSFSDYVKDEIDRMEDADYAPADAQALIDDVAAFTAKLAQTDGVAGHDLNVPDEGSGAAPEADKALIGEAAADDGGLVGEMGGIALKLSFKPDVPMVNARALVIMKQLAKQVKVLSHTPHDLANAEAARVIAEEGLLVVVEADDVEKAKKQLAANSFIRRIVELDDTTSVSAANARDGEPSDAASSADKFITLRWNSVRDLQDMAGEFLLHTSHLKSLCSTLPEESELRRAVSQTTRLVEELVYHVDKMAMVNVSAMIPQLSRMVRDMCRDSGKQVSFEVHGGDIDIDRNLYNSISEPLLHIIRNAVDHGIEPPEERLSGGKEARGVVALSVENLGTRVAFRVSDDGRGIDADAVLAKAQAKGMLEKPADSYTRSEILHMVMMPGLSTSKEVTRYSGRGVGMDVVSAVVRDFNGRIEIESDLGHGTTTTLFMPVSVTSVDCLCFRIGPSVYHMPLLNLSKIFTADEAAPNLSSFEGSELLDFEKRQVPVLDLHRALASPGKAAFYIVCHSLGDEFVIGVDDILGEFSCSSKPLPSHLGPAWQAACPIRNVAIMEDGTVGYVLHAAILADLAQGRSQLREQADDPESQASEALLPDAVSTANMPAWAFVFELGEERYAISIDQVERLNPMLECARTPKAPHCCKGLVNYHNQAIAVFDLAQAAGARGECSHMLVVKDDRGELAGMAITSAVGVYDLSEAILADEQPEPRFLAGGLRTAYAFLLDPKRPPITMIIQK